MFRSVFAAALLALSGLPLSGQAEAATKTAILAGGCFWCVEKDFDHVHGVVSTTSGYAGGTSRHPTYGDYVAGGHREVVRIEYDDARVSYEQLLDAFWHSVDPTDAGGQFCDRGYAYSTAIYVADEAELKAAELSKKAAGRLLGQPIVTEIALAPAFWPAEDYHQGYAERNPIRYRFYRSSCGRDDRIRQLWGATAHQGIEGY